MDMVTLNKKQVKELNIQLEKMSRLYDEICKAESVGVPGLEGQKQYCLDMQERIKKLKSQYAPNQA